VCAAPGGNPSISVYKHGYVRRSGKVAIRLLS